MNTLIQLRKFFQDEILKSTVPDNFDDDFDLVKYGILDSLAIMSLAGFIEEEFGIAIGSEDIVPENFSTIKSIVHYIENKQNG